MEKQSQSSEQAPVLTTQTHESSPDSVIPSHSMTPYFGGRSQDIVSYQMRQSLPDLNTYVTSAFLQAPQEEQPKSTVFASITWANGRAIYKKATTELLSKK